MKNFNIILFIFLIFFSSFKFTSANDQIAFIDIDYIIKNSNIGKASLDKLETLNKKNINKLNLTIKY